MCKNCGFTGFRLIALSFLIMHRTGPVHFVKSRFCLIMKEYVVTKSPFVLKAQCEEE